MRWREPGISGIRIPGLAFSNSIISCLAVRAERVADIEKGDIKPK